MTDADRIAELESMLESQCAAYIVCDKLRQKAEAALAAAPTERRVGQRRVKNAGMLGRFAVRTGDRRTAAPNAEKEKT